MNGRMNGDCASGGDVYIHDWVDLSYYVVHGFGFGLGWTNS